MSRDHAGLQAILREITRNPERSDLFRWMVEHHTELIDAAKGRRLRWRSLCERFAQLGLSDMNGKPPTPATARKTWQRARAAVVVAQCQAAQSPHRQVSSNSPSRVRKEWQPEEVTPPTRTQTAGTPAAVIASVPRPTSVEPIGASVASGSTRTPEEVQAMIERALDDCHNMDWYLTLGAPRRKAK